MAQQTINVGTAPNDGTGTPLRTAFQYTNSNFTELYTATGPSGNNITVPGNATITGDLTVDTSTLKVDSANNLVGIRTASPTAGFGLTISGNNGLVLDKGATNQFLAQSFRNSTQNYSVYLDQDGIGSNSWSLFDTTNSQTAIRYYPGASGYWQFYTQNIERARIDSSGNLGLANGNLVMSTSGKGIDFSATANSSGTMTSELLNDYEEGTFTPDIRGSTTAGIGTYTGRYGYYTKVGRLVTINLFLDWSAHTGTGVMLVSGLPFANSSTFSAATIGYANNIALTAGNILSGYVDASQSWILLNQIPTGGGANSNVPMDTAGVLVISASYIV